MKLINSKCFEVRLFFRLIIGGDFLKLKSEGYVPRKDLDPIVISIPMKWNSSDRNVEFNLHAWRFLSAAWAYYVKNPTGLVAKEVFGFAIDVASDWSEFIKNNKSKYAWYDMSVGIRAMHIAFMKYLCSKHNAGSWEDEKFVDHLAEQHMIWLSRQENITRGNHAIYEIIGLKILAEIYGLDSYNKFAKENILQLFNDAFDENYITSENSPFYHQYNLDIFTRIPTVLFPELKDKLFTLSDEGARISRWLTAPSGEFYRIGDTEGFGKSLGISDISDDQKKNDIVWLDLKESGYQIVRSSPSISNEEFSLIFRGGKNSNVHAHQDALSFIYYHDGVEILADAGKYTYEHGKERDWFISDVAHNTFGIKGRCFLPEDQLQGSAFINNLIPGNSYKLSGENFISDAIYHKRQLELYPGDGLLVNDEAEILDSGVAELRYIFGDKISLGSPSKKGEIFSLYFKNKKLSSVYLTEKPEAIIFSSPEYPAWISKSYHKKEEVLQVKFHFDKKNIRIKSGFSFIKEGTVSNILNNGKVNLAFFVKNRGISYFSKNNIPTDYDYFYESCKKIFFRFSQKGAFSKRLEEVFLNNRLEIPSIYSNKKAISRVSLYVSGHNVWIFRDGDRYFYIVQSGPTIGSWISPIILISFDLGLCVSFVNDQDTSKKIVKKVVAGLERVIDNYGSIDKFFNLSKDNWLVNNYNRPYHYFYDKMPFLHNSILSTKTELNVISGSSSSFLQLSALYPNISNEKIIDSLADFSLHNPSFLIDPFRDGTRELQSRYDEIFSSFIYRKYYNESRYFWIGVCEERRPWAGKKNTISKLVINILDQDADAIFVFDGMTRPFSKNYSEFVKRFCQAEHDIINWIAKKCGLNAEQYVNLSGATAVEKFGYAVNSTGSFTSALTDSIWASKFGRGFGLVYAHKNAKHSLHKKYKAIIVPDEYIESYKGSESHYRLSYEVSEGFVERFFNRNYLRMQSQDKYLLEFFKRIKPLSFMKNLLYSKGEITFYANLNKDKKYVKFSKGACLDKGLFIANDSVCSGGANFHTVVIFYDKHGIQLSHKMIKSGEREYIGIPEDASEYKLFARISGIGNIKFYGFGEYSIKT